MKRIRKHFDETLLRRFYLVIGWLMVICAFIGIFLPILPTVPFLIVAAWCFSRSSPRFSHWLYNHPLFGPPLKRWEERGAINMPAKCMAIGGMTGGFFIVFFFVSPPLWVTITLGTVLLVTAIYIISRPLQ